MSPLSPSTAGVARSVIDTARESASNVRTLVLAAAMAVLAVVQIVSVDDEAHLVDRLVFTLVPMVLLWSVAARFVLGGRPLAAAALFVAISPTVFASAVAGERHGALAAVAACAAAVIPTRRRPRAPAVFAGCAVGVVAGLVLWWGSGVSRGRAPGPSWREIVDETGSLVARGLAVVGPDEVAAPITASLLWWGGVGVVVGAALLGRMPLAAVSVPAAVACFVAVGWSIALWRGPVDPAGGMFLVAAAVAFTGASAAERSPLTARIACALTVVVTAVWAISLVELHRAADASPFAIGAVAIGIATVAAVLWPPAAAGGAGSLG